MFGLWAYFAYLNRPPDWPAVHAGAIARLIGWACLAGGLTITAVVMGWFGIRRSLGLEVILLKQSGFYGVTRNPQAVAFAMGMIGYTVLWPSWRSLGAVAIYAAIVHMMVLTEEEHLHDRYGEVYAQYCKRVPRYVGVRRLPKTTV
jgi:protein-S-isoprenylcysteine O-methyltransferase Ste14